MRDLSGTGQVYRFTLSQLLKSRANRVTLIIMMLLKPAIPVRLQAVFTPRILTAGFARRRRHRTPRV